MARNRNADATADAAPAQEAPPAPDLAAAYDALLAQHNGALARIAELEAALERNDAALKALASAPAPAAVPAASSNPFEFHPKARTFLFCKGAYSVPNARRIKALSQRQALAQLAAEVGDVEGYKFYGCPG